MIVHSSAVNLSCFLITYRKLFLDIDCLLCVFEFVYLHICICVSSLNVSVCSAICCVCGGMCLRVSVFARTLDKAARVND